jgi:hypothetical protein
MAGHACSDHLHRHERAKTERHPIKPASLFSPKQSVVSTQQQQQQQQAPTSTHPPFSTRDGITITITATTTAISPTNFESYTTSQESCLFVGFDSNTFQHRRHSFSDLPPPPCYALLLIQRLITRPHSFSNYSRSCITTS